MDRIEAMAPRVVKQAATVEWFFLVAHRHGTFIYQSSVTVESF
jgi:hypothetical protein